MATSTSQPPFPSRPYTSGLGRSTFQHTPYNSQTPFNAPAQGPTQQQQQAQRLEREQRELAERNRRETDERNILESLSDEQREEVNEAFSLFDLDKDSYIDYHELKVAFKALGFEVEKAEISYILQTHGISASSLTNSKAPAPAQPTFSGPNRLLLSHTAFLNVAARKVLDRDPRDEIIRAFELFDQEGKGRIELNDLRRVARELGEGLQEEELRAMIEEFDIKGEGGIGQEEFIGICMG